MVLRFDVNSAARSIIIVSTVISYKPEWRQLVYLKFCLELIALDSQEFKISELDLDAKLSQWTSGHVSSEVVIAKS
ncbi:hypothetical protein TNCV_3090561 [Trichonephila clavipes]|uniref:Uncharacterized protein n=1 Tax=Trichonephila clavipes TaxID=2585209 RepID=A0A8X6W8C2_TRICX|nr:hypothetical protein TNCV_3090561 [Trichonephila clavipes]